MLHYNIIIRGEVQGVGFRYYAQKSAHIYGVCGWVKNKADGSVEADVEGSETNIAEFIGALKRGSSYSYVESLDIEKTDDICGYRTFDIVDDE